MGRLHPAQALLASADRLAHRLDLVRRFDRAREVEEREPVDRHEAFGGKRRGAGGIEPVERDAAAAAALAHEGRDLAGKGARRRGGVRAGRHVIPGLGGTNLVDGLEMARQMLAIAEVEERRVAVGGHAHVTARIVQAVDLHVARVARVADVDRIEEHDRREIVASERGADAVSAVGAQRDRVGRHAGSNAVPKSSIPRARSHRPRGRCLLAAPQQPFLVREGRQQLVAVARDERAFLELDAVDAARGADVALDRQDHAFLEDAVVAARVPVAAIDDDRPLVGETDAVHHVRVAIRIVGLRKRERLLGDLAEAHARLQQSEVVPDLLDRERIHLPLVGVRLARTRVERARDVAAESHRPDHVGVERHEVAGADHAVAAFLEPRIRAAARREEPGLDAFAAVADVRLVQERPQRVLGHSRLQRFAHPRDAAVAHRERVRHSRDLVRRLDRARVLHDLLALEDFDALGAHEVEAQRIQAVEGDAAIAAAMIADHGGDRLGERLRLLDLPHAGRHVVPADERAALADGLDAFGEMLAAAEFEQDRLAFRRHEAVAGGHVRRPHGHVASPGRVAHVEGIAEESAGVVVLPELRLDARQAIGPHPLHVGLPFVLRQRHAGRPAGGRMHVGTDNLGRHVVRPSPVRPGYFVVGIMNSAPARMPDGQRCVTAFCRV